MAKAILLLSGGLDSILAGALVKKLGVDVEGFHFVNVFSQGSFAPQGCSSAERSARQLGIDIHMEQCGPDYLDVVKNPRHGYGKGVNPCIDCRTHIYKLARKYMAECGADFAVSGEVLGERPMSQHRRAMDTVENESGLNDILLRPLSALLLPPTKPERDGLIDREKLRSIQGRRRQPQFDLADELGIEDFETPGGGCLLTETEYAARFRDLLEHDPGFGVEDARMLRFGRLFRLPSGTQVLVARDQNESEYVENTSFEDGIVLVPSGETGPSVLCRNVEDSGDVNVAASIMAAYTKGGRRINVEILGRKGDGGPNILEDVEPFDRDVAVKWRIGAS